MYESTAEHMLEEGGQWYRYLLPSYKTAHQLASELGLVVVERGGECHHKKLMCVSDETQIQTVWGVVADDYEHSLEFAVLATATDVVRRAEKIAVYLSTLEPQSLVDVA